MPITFMQLNSAPEPASNNRYAVYFPNVGGIDMKDLTLFVHTITLPQTGIGHVLVRLFDQVVGFRGGRVFENQITIRFQENVRGYVLQKIEQWRQLVRDVNGNSGLKSSYAGDGLLNIYDTVGNVIHAIALKNLFPLTVEYPELDEAGSAPLEFSVTFSVDMSELDLRG